MTMSIAIIGEAWGNEEEKERAPFVGPTGYLLTKMLGEAGIRRSDCLLTNVFNLRPKWNRIDYLCGPKSNALAGYPPIAAGRYIRAEFEPELLRLGDELLGANPNIIILLGATAMWAMLGKTTISKFRGYIDTSTHTVSDFKVLPTYHPAAIFRQWEYRPLVVLDLAKANRESKFPEVRYPKRELWIEPTLEDLHAFARLHLKHCEVLSVDIESSGHLITCIGFAVSSSVALVIPFYDPRAKDKSYWPNRDSERQAWDFVRSVLEGGIRKLFQNGLFDIAFLWRANGIRVRNVEHDTMLLHHALQPESLKGLGFLGSLYTNERAWKQMRTDHETIKRDD
jgi:DNA polymerase